jgi:O-antigen/teichoic acid export membrane protein
VKKQNKSKQILQYLVNNKFLQAVAVVAGGTTIAQAINLGFSPIVTRFYGPEAFGVLGVFSSVITILSPLVTMAYIHAIALPKKDRDALDLLWLSIRIAVVACILLFLIFMLFRKPLANALGYASLGPFLFLIAPVLLFVGIDHALGEWLVRKKQFKTIGGVEIGRALALGSAKTGVGFFSPTATVLIILTLLGHVLHAFLLYKGSFKSISAARKQESGVVKSNVAHTYRDFPMFRASQIFINTVSMDLPMLMLASFFGPAAAGFYSIGRRVMMLPATIIRTAVNKVFLPYIVEAVHEKREIQRILIKLTLTMSLIGIFPFSIVFIFGPQLFSFLFGAEWLIAGQYARWLALWLFFSFINGPCGQAVSILGLQGKVLIHTIAVILSRVGVILLGGLYYQNELLTIKMFSFIGMFFNILLMIGVFYASNRNKREL